MDSMERVATGGALAGSEALAASGALNPSLWDAAFPVIAFVLVIVVPSLVAVWAIVKTARERDVGEGES